MKRFQLTIATMTLMLIVSSSALAGNIGAAKGQQQEPAVRGNIGAMLAGNIGTLAGNIGAGLCGDAPRLLQHGCESEGSASAFMLNRRSSATLGLAALLRGDFPHATGTVVHVDGGLAIPRL